jgi:DNA polymerase III subunit delta'
MIHAWNRTHWTTLHARPAGLPSAILLAGPAGVGKRAFADALAIAMLCSDRSPATEACGECRSCQLFAVASHPDYRLLEPATAETADGAESATPRSRIIGVDRVRELQDFVAMARHTGNAKVVVIQPADRLHLSAANALLKMLEEPSAVTHFLLVTDRAQQLLPTVRSRCYRIDFSLPEPEAARAWLRTRGIDQPEIPLAQAGFAPLVAEQLADHTYLHKRRMVNDLLGMPSVKASELSKVLPTEELSTFWAFLYRWCYDLAASGAAGQVRYNPDYAKSLSRIAVNLDQQRLQQFVKELVLVAQSLEHPLNARLVSERLAIGYTRAVANQEP